MLPKKIADYYRRSLKSTENFIIIKYFGRPLALPLVYLFDRMGWSANQVTLLGGATWAAALSLMLLASPDAGTALFLSALALLLGGVLDIVDGGIARIRESFCMSGAYLDYVLHFVFNPLLPVCIGAFLAKAYECPFLLYLGIAAIPGSWGFSQAAKQHVFLKNRSFSRRVCDTADPAQYNRAFFDESSFRTPISESPSALSLLKKLPMEFFFPGNFFAFPAAIFGDLILRAKGIETSYALLATLFVFYAGTLAVSVPFRMRREFRTIRSFE